MILILACVFLFHQYSTIAVPVSSPFSSQLLYDAPIFTRDNSPPARLERTVWDILWSCLATTFAVTWVSIHPNVPYLEEKSWSLLKRRIFLMCLALFAPEVTIMWAFKQWRGAAMIRRAINEAFLSEPCRQWSMVHAHWLQMGGLRLRCTQAEAYKKDGLNPSDWNCLQQAYSYLSSCEPKGQVWEGVLQYSMFKKLLEEGKIDFPEISKDEINDRSKGDALSKGVALLQITWFIIQLIARAHQHLTITEFELTTAALAGLNSIMYLFWWNKPHDARCPIVIRTKELDKLLVEKINEREREGEHQPGGKKWTFPADEDFNLGAYLIGHRNSPNIDPVNLVQKKITAIRSVPRSSNGRGSEDFFLWTVITRLFYLPYLLSFLPVQMILNPERSFKLFTATDCFRDAKDKINSKPTLHLLFVENDMMWILSMIFYSVHAEKRPLLIFSALAGAAFGSIHCAAWHFNFPSNVERIIWRTASLAIVGVCLCIVAGAPLYNFVRKWNNTFWNICKRSLETIPAIIYPVARLSLLVLAVLSLRHPPPSALESVAWTKFIPHI